MIRPLLTLATLAVATLVAAAPARAETRRIAVIVGHNTGNPGEVPLRFAEEDAGKVADVLVDLGDVRVDDLFLVQGKGVAVVKDALARASARATLARAVPDDRVVVLFYYSGHADGVAMELGRDRLTFAELKTYLAGTGADVKLGIVDSCKSGALLATKGGSKGPAFDIGLVDALASSGEVMLTSSAADEVALESSEIRGSFFTHHLVSGLRGAADTSGDGRVTLSEAYDYAFHRTISSSTQAGAAPQHPSYDYRMAGRGELVVTEVSKRSAAIELPAGFERALVIHVRRDQVIAELTSDATRRIAVAPGDYAVRLWRQGVQQAGRIAVGVGDVVGVAWTNVTPVGGVDRAGKGSDARPIHERPDPNALSPEAQAEYDRAFLQVGEMMVSPDGSTVPSRSTGLYLGKHRRKISPLEFYRAVGRADLVVRHEKRARLKKTLIVGGVMIIAAGVVAGIATYCWDSPDVGDPRFSSCIDDSITGLGLAMAGGTIGAVAIVVGGTMRNRQAEPHELRAMAEDYNTALRTRLRSGVPPGATPILTEVQVSPWAGPGGGGLVLSGRF